MASRSAQVLLNCPPISACFHTFYFNCMSSFILALHGSFHYEFGHFKYRPKNYSHSECLDCFSVLKFIGLSFDSADAFHHFPYLSYFVDSNLVPKFFSQLCLLRIHLWSPILTAQSLSEPVAKN